MVIVQPYWFPAASTEFRITVHCLDRIVDAENIGASVCFLKPHTTATFELRKVSGVLCLRRHLFAQRLFYAVAKAWLSLCQSRWAEVIMGNNCP